MKYHRIISICLVLFICFAFLHWGTICTDASNYSSWYAERVNQRLASFSSSSYSTTYFKAGQCTWYCYGRAIEKLGAYLPCRGDASTWYSSALAEGWSGGWEVRSNSIACYGNNHVIFVEWVDGDTVYFTEANMNLDGKVSSDDGILKKNTINYLLGRLSGTYQGCIYLEGNPYDIDIRYPSFYAYTLSTGNVECYNTINGSRAGDIWPGDRCLVEEVYTNGWCKVKCPWPDDRNMKTVYAPLSAFIYDPSYVHTEHTLLYGTQGYKKNNMSEGYEWLDARTYCRRVSKVDGHTQVIAWKEGVGNHLTWIWHTGDYIEGVNVGSDFYAYIINERQWRYITRDVYPDGVSNVSLRSGVGNESQIWKFVYWGNGYYRIINPQSGEDLEVLYSQDADGANVKTWTWYNGDSQLWMLCGRWNGGVTIEPKLSNTRFLDVAGDDTLEGTNIHIWPNNGHSAQRFRILTDLHFTVRYDSNGGFNAPASQDNLQYLTTITLSQGIPTSPSYTITYDANGGSVITDSKHVSADFSNWNTIRDGTGAWYSPGAQIEIHGETVLYAQWTPPAAGSLPAPTRPGFTFIGWFTAPEGGTEIIADTVVTSNITLYAHWEQAVQYFVGDIDLDHDVDSHDLTALARHVGGIELLSGQALRNADVDGDMDVDSHDLTRHARYVGGIITDWDQEYSKSSSKLKGAQFG